MVINAGLLRHKTTVQRNRREPGDVDMVADQWDSVVEDYYVALQAVTTDDNRSTYHFVGRYDDRIKPDMRMCLEHYSVHLTSVVDSTGLRSELQITAKDE